MFRDIIPTPRRALVFIAGALLATMSYALYCSCTPSKLHAAVLRGDAAEVDRLLSVGYRQVSWTPCVPSQYKGVYPLHIACYANKTDIIDIALRHHSDTEVVDGFGLTPLLVASRITVDSKAVIALLSHGANVNATDRRGYTAAMTAAESRIYNTVAVLADHGANVKLVAVDGNTLLHLLVSGRAPKPIVLRVLELGANPRAMNARGDSPLSLSDADNQDAEVYQLLKTWNKD